MKLWIRTQDNRCLENCDRLYYNENAYSEHCITNGNYSIAKYKNKERCIEILNDIQYQLTITAIGQNVLVYQMPNK